MVVGWLLACPGVAWSLELPAGPLANLKSEEFRQREDAQAELLAWARRQADGATDELLRQSRVADDPEVRERCLDVLRELVNDEYLKDGEGFIGIQMLDELANVPGDPKPRGVIRVILVVADSAAQQAGLQVNDLIAGMGDLVWHEGGASLDLPGENPPIEAQHQGHAQSLAQWQPDGSRSQIGSAPAAGGLRCFSTSGKSDLEAAERAAKEAYFRRWLERRKSQK